MAPALWSQSDVRVVQRLTFLELAERPSAGRLSRSLSDSALLRDASGSVVPAFRGLLEPAFAPAKEEASCEEEPELANTSVGDEAEVADTCSICSWATDQDREGPSAYLGFHSTRQTCDHGRGIPQAFRGHALQLLMHDQGCASSSSRSPVDARPWKPRRQRVRKFPKPSRREPVQEHLAALADARPTTLILRSVPDDWALQDVAALLDAEGFRSAYDFLHVPVKFHDMRNVGYAIVNMQDHEAADAVRRRLQGLELGLERGGELLAADWNATSQGLPSQVAKYRNSAVMHESVPEQHRPGLFAGGLRVPFPPPTELIRAPRVRINKRIA